MRDLPEESGWRILVPWAGLWRKTCEFFTFQHGTRRYTPSLALLMKLPAQGTEDHQEGE
jgi:hypothetical protein